MNTSLTAALPRTLALALTVLLASACADKPSDPIAASTAPAATEAVASDDEPMFPEGAFGSGTLSFELKPDAALQLPVTFCAGQGTILTIAAREGEAQVDLRVIELPALRDGKPLVEVTEAGYRFTGTDQGRTFWDTWQTRSLDEVVRDGDTTRVRGKMYGLRSYDKGNGVGTTPEGIDGRALREFNLEVTCSS
jgi:hypothetical protein